MIKWSTHIIRNVVFLLQIVSCTQHSKEIILNPNQQFKDSFIIKKQSVATLELIIHNESVPRSFTIDLSAKGNFESYHFKQFIGDTLLKSDWYSDTCYIYYVPTDVDSVAKGTIKLEIGLY